MSLKRFAVILAVLLTVQAGAFGYFYRDLLRLREPAGTLASDPRAFEQAANRALTRTALTRRHLETIADGASRVRDAATEQAALRRLVEAYPDDTAVRLRYAESLRLAGRLREAEDMYTSVLQRPATAGARR
jgi:hypothetical protein